jgi:hypothetical protein
MQLRKTDLNTENIYFQIHGGRESNARAAVAAVAAAVAAVAGPASTGSCSTIEWINFIHCRK